VQGLLVGDRTLKSHEIYTLIKSTGMEKLGSALAIQFLTNVLPPIFSAPIGSQIIARTAADAGISEVSQEAYRYLIVYCGLSTIFSSFLLLMARGKITWRVFHKV
jgi:hypothetical protein